VTKLRYRDMNKEQRTALAQESREWWEQRKQNATPEELEVYLEIDRREANQNKYIETTEYYRQLDSNHLHHQSYEQRLAKAAKLNGCKFKKANPTKRQFASREHTDIHYHCGECDGQVAILRRGMGVWFLCILLAFAVFFVAFGLVTTAPFDVGFGWLGFFGGLIGGPLGIYLVVQLWRKLDFLDKFEFNRHTGLVRMPHKLFRRPFYIPIEDIELSIGPVVQSARGGGERGSGALFLTKYPAKYWFRPSYSLFFGGIEEGHWTSLIHFMDITQPVNEDVHIQMEKHYKKDRNAMGTGPYPEIMKRYFDKEDQQVNCWEVW